jgi:hypothetical protein
MKNIIASILFIKEHHIKNRAKATKGTAMFIITSTPFPFSLRRRGVGAN